jgi:pyruvate/2-oxoglutarate/acetoin dehydrogenase E1 component
VTAFAAEELFGDLDAPVTRVGAADCHLPYNAPEEEAIIPGVGDVLAAAERVLAY